MAKKKKRRRKRRGEIEMKRNQGEKVEKKTNDQDKVPHLVQKVGLIFEKVWRALLHGFLQELRLGRGDAVPSFGFAPMQIIDGVTPMVLDVPAKGGEAHAHVAPRDLHAADVAADVAQDGSFQHR